MSNTTPKPTMRHAGLLPQKFNKIFSFCIALLVSLLIFETTNAQQFYNYNTGTSGNSYPFATSDKRIQWLYNPGEFNSAGTTGNPAGAGNITKVYFRTSGTFTNATYTNFSIKLGQNVGTITGFTSGTYITGLTTCLTSASYVIPSGTANGWVGITLTTPFYYNPTQSLVIEIIQTAVVSGGWTVLNTAPSSGNHRIYGASAATTGTADAGYANMGLDISANSYDDAGVLSIDSPYVYCSAATYPVKATIKNFGRNQISSVFVNWSANGVRQTSVYLSGSPLLDTLGGANPSISQVALGSYFFGTTPVTIKAWDSIPNATLDTVPLNDSAFAYNMQMSMNGGTYTINSALPSTSTNFQTFGAAIAQMKVAGICGPVLFNVAAGTYVEQVNISGPITGVSATNTITFDGGAGNAPTRIVTWAGTSTAYQTLSIQGVKYVTVKNLTINGTSSSYAFGVLINGNSQYSRLSNCVVNVPLGVGSTGLIPLCVGGSTTAYSAGGRVDSLLIDSNVFNGGYFSHTWYSSSGSYSQMNRVIGNTLKNYYQYAMYVYYQNGFNLSYNRIIAGSYITTSYGVYAPALNNTGINPTIINGNRISGFGYYGLYLTGTNLAANKSQITNNMIGGRTATGAYLVYITTGNWYIAHNSFHSDFPQSSATYGVYLSGGTGTSIVNNIFSSSKSGNLGLPLYVGAASYVDTMDYNIFYREDTSNNQLIYVGGYYNSGNFKGGGNAAFNMNSIYAVPGFVNDTNLHISNSCYKGMTLPANHAIPLDLDGNTRGTPPVMGAHEPPTFSLDLGVIAITSPVPPITTGAQDLKVRVRNFGTSTIYGFSISYTLNGGSAVTQTWSGSLAQCDTTTVTFTSSNQITLGNVNLIKIYTASPNASTDLNRNNDTINVSYYTPMSGTYTIGATGANFTSFTQAINTMATATIVGPIYFNVLAGTYNEQVVVPGSIIGSSVTNTITFDGGNGNVASRIITVSLNSQGTVILNQCRYVTFRNFTINNTFTGAAVGAAIIGNATNNAGTGCSFNNCIINLPNTGTFTAYGISITATAGGYGQSAQRADSVYIDSNTINGGYYGISYYGATSASYNRAIRFNRNIISNVYYYGMMVYYIYNPLDIIYNTVNSTNGYSMYIYGCTNSSSTSPTHIIGNKVLNHYYYGMYLYTIGGTAAAPVQVFNNIVTSGTITAYYGLYLSASYAQVFHNTCLFYLNTATTSYGPYYNATTNACIKNNIFGVEAAGSASAIYCATNPYAGLDSVNYNIYYHKGTGALGYRNGTFYYPATSGIWTAPALGDTSYNFVPTYAGPTDYHPVNGCGNRGFNLTYICPIDMDGNIRSSNPVIGCYDYPSLALDLGLLRIKSPTFPISSGTQDFKIYVTNNGSSTIYTFGMSYKLNGGATVTTAYSGTIAPCGLDSVTFTGSQQITLANGVNTIKVWSTSPNALVDSNRVNDTISGFLSTPLNGNYTINWNAATTGTNYQTFTAAINDIALRGVGGPTTFNVSTGTYTEDIIVGNYTAIGASPASPITFKSSANNPDSVLLTGTGSGYVVKLLNACYINFKGITMIENVVSSGTVNLVGTLVNDTFYNCKILFPQTTTTSYTFNCTGANMVGVCFRKNVLQGGYYGLYWNSNSSLWSQNCTVDSSTFNYCSYYPIYFYYNTYLKFNNNIVNLGSGPTPYSYCYLMYMDTGCEVSYNTISTPLAGGYGYIYLMYYSVANSSNHSSFHHNKIDASGAGTYIYGYYPGYYGAYIDYYDNYLNFGTGGAYGIYYLAYQGHDIRFYNNTVYAAATSYNVYYYNVGVSNIDIKNNTFYSNNSLPAFYIGSASPGATETFDCNNYYSASSTTPIYAPSSSYNISAWKSLAANRAVGRDRNSLSYNPGFTNVTSGSVNLLPNLNDSSTWSLRGRAIPTSWITSDFNNTPRSTVVAAGPTCIGAFEFTPSSTTLPPLAAISPSVTPAASTTQYFLFGGDTLASIAWGSVYPASIGLRAYPGTQPPMLGSTTSSYDYTKVYWNFTSPAGSYLYDIGLHYKDIWLGNIPSKSVLIGAAKYPGIAWSSNIWYSCTNDTIMDTIGNTYQSTITNAYFAGTTSTSPLPVKLDVLNAVRAGNIGLVSWTTASEINSNHFEVERHTGDGKWTNQGNVKAYGNSSVQRSYQFSDEIGTLINKHVNTIYYRLKMVDLNGSFTYSKVVTIGITEKVNTNLSVFPNPFSDELTLNISVTKETPAVITVMDISGKVIFVTNVTLQSGTSQKLIPEAGSLHNGIYFMKVETSNDTKVLKIVKE